MLTVVNPMFALMMSMTVRQRSVGETFVKIPNSENKTYVFGKRSQYSH